MQCRRALPTLPASRFPASVEDAESLVHGVYRDDDAICALLTRLARPDASGGDIIERAAILAAGSDFAAIVAWVIAHGGKPETVAAAVPRGGLRFGVHYDPEAFGNFSESIARFLGTARFLVPAPCACDTTTSGAGTGRVHPRPDRPCSPARDGSSSPNLAGSD